MQKRFVLIFASLLLFLLPVIYADIAPHPSARVNFFVTHNNQTIKENFRADIIMCLQDGCTHSDNAVECTKGVCSFYYYRIERVPSQMKLQVTLKDKIFTSGVFNFSSRTSPRESYYKVNIDSNWKMTVISDNKGVGQEGSAITDSEGLSLLVFSFIYAVILTICIELAVLIIFLKKWNLKKWKTLILAVVLANLVSIPLVWIIILFFAEVLSSFFVYGALIAIIVGEAFAIVFEAYFVRWMNKKVISLKKAFILSVVMNVASFVIGGTILALL